jgi:hypothetical protein
MGDFDFSRLDPRSFEQLIQAISVKIFGPKVVIFGDGPDGSREATFEGEFSYGENVVWRGYGIVQAKFHQRPSNRHEDGKWAFEQFQKELKKFSKSRRKVRKPEYFIFTTNVVLTPVLGKGSKDVINELMEQYRKEIPLKDYDIWDYDKICRFLDCYQDIRYSYAAWITPGDVLANVIEMSKPHKGDVDQILTNFLQKEFMSDLFARLEQAGHTTEDRVQLASVFVDLPAFDELKVEAVTDDFKNGKLKPGFINEILNIASKKLDPTSLTSRVIADPSKIDLS